jgi:hypothetical protein
MDNCYYIYIYLDPREFGKYLYKNFSFMYKPIYIGKGKNKRYKIERGRNLYLKNTLNKIKKLGLIPIIFKLYENLSEEQSFEFEKNIIQEIGRFDLGTGPLLNMTDGGDGSNRLIVSEKIRKKFRKNFQDIKKEFEKRNYILLTEEKEYKNNKQKLKYICPEGHIGFIKWNDFQQGYGCTIEGNKSSSIKRKKDFSFIEQEFKKRKYILLEEKNRYKNSFTKLKYICPNGHENFICWNNFQQGQGCPVCYKNKRKIFLNIENEV